MFFSGSPYVLRALNPNDADTLQHFFYSHDEDTIYQRYGHPLKVMTDQDALRLVSVDQSCDLALGLFEVGSDGEILNAVGRYCLDRSGLRAEAAFVVRENKRRQGLASCLLNELIQIARARGLQALWASVLIGNIPMIRGLKKFGFRETYRDNDGIEFEFPIQAPDSKTP
ncbi:MAG: GNAT family N-acetyltransferase [Candidatus Methylacidiphilales bacterium]